MRAFCWNVLLNQRVMLFLDRRELPRHCEKSDQYDQTFGIECLKAEDDQIKNQAQNHGHRTTDNQFMPLGFCHGAPPKVQITRKPPYFRHFFYDIYDRSLNPTEVIMFYFWIMIPCLINQRSPSALRKHVY